MAETTSTAAPPLKRHREEDEEQETLVEEEMKRQKPSSFSSSSSSYNQILCLLEDEPNEPDNEPGHDLTPFIATLQQEISSDDQNAVVSSSDDVNAGNGQGNKPMLCSSSSSSTSCSSKEEEDEGGDDKDRVMRHLLEASDDELGIPSTTDFGGSDYGLISDIANYDYANGVGGGGLWDGVGDALWELEDEAANYYTLLQSELFM